MLTSWQKQAKPSQVKKPVQRSASKFLLQIRDTWASGAGLAALRRLWPGSDRMTEEQVRAVRSWKNQTFLEQTLDSKNEFWNFGFYILSLKIKVPIKQLFNMIRRRHHMQLNGSYTPPPPLPRPSQPNNYVMVKCCLTILDQNLMSLKFSC